MKYIAILLAAVFPFVVLAETEVGEPITVSYVSTNGAATTNTTTSSMTYSGYLEALRVVIVGTTTCNVTIATAGGVADVSDTLLTLTDVSSSGYYPLRMDAYNYNLAATNVAVRRLLGGQRIKVSPSSPSNATTVIKVIPYLEK